MSNIHTIPTYADFRAELDRLYPDMVGRIAIGDFGESLEAPVVAPALRTQLSALYYYTLPAAFIDTIEAVFQRYKIASEKDAVHFSCLPLNPDVVFMLADCRGLEDVSKTLHLISDRSVPAPQLAFNRAAVTPGMMGWMFFYHEMSHALIALDRHPLHKRDGRDVYIEESICDSFAALHMAKRFGAQALPLLDVFADIRLSRLRLSGPAYFSALALRAIVKDVRDGTLDDLGMADVDDIFAGALAYARNNEMNRNIANSLYAVTDKPDLLAPHLAMRQAIAPTLEKSYLCDALAESKTIMQDRYTDKTASSSLPDVGPRHDR